VFTPSVEIQHCELAQLLVVPSGHLGNDRRDARIPAEASGALWAWLQLSWRKSRTVSFNSLGASPALGRAWAPRAARRENAKTARLIRFIEETVARMARGPTSA
jgi:hypothetical protein